MIMHSILLLIVLLAIIVLIKNLAAGSPHRPILPTRIASILIIALAVILSFICVLIGRFVPTAFCILFDLKSWDDAWGIMPIFTQLACGHIWIFVLLLGTICFGSLLALRRFSNRTIECLTIGLCAQGLVVWLAMFCFFFFGFTRSREEFWFPHFVSFGAGVFPVTFLLVVVSMIAALWNCMGTGK